MKFDRDFAPEGWNYAQDDDPDVVFMGWGGYPEGGTAAAVQRGAQGRSGWCLILARADSESKVRTQVPRAHEVSTMLCSGSMAKKKKDAIPEDQMTQMAQDFFQEAVKDLVPVRFVIWSDEYGPGLLLSEAIEGIEGYTIEKVKCVNVYASWRRDCECERRRKTFTEGICRLSES
jgi:hypothetical protein